MLSENIKNLRKNKGYTQEELAIRLHVVRQTVSKWEKGLSVPDAQVLQQLADVLDTSVDQLLGVTIAEESMNELAQQLARINEQLAIKNRRTQRIWKTIGVSILVIVVTSILLSIAGIVAYDSLKIDTQQKVEEVEVLE